VDKKEIILHGEKNKKITPFELANLLEGKITGEEGKQEITIGNKRKTLKNWSKPNSIPAWIIRKLME
jgi:hypothetical protein